MYRDAILKSSQDYDDAILESGREAETPSHDEEDESIIAEESVDAEEQEEVPTPISPEHLESAVWIMFVSIPPEDYNRLPFMTPIAKKTESSLGAFTARAKKEEFISKTPSKANGQNASSIFRNNDKLDSSPLQEVIDEPLPLTKKIPPLALSVMTKNKALPLTKLVANGAAFSRDIATSNPPPTTYEGYFNHSAKTHGKSAKLKKFAKAVAKMKKNASDKTTTNIAMPPILSFLGAKREYMVKRELGAGAFAPVYLIETVTDSNDTTETNENGPEFYIMRQASRRLSITRAADSLIQTHEFHLYRDECYLIETYRDQGTLLNLVNIARADNQQAGGVMDELLAMFFAIELLRTVEALHKAGILHGDLKADNVLVHLGGGVGAAAAWSA
ncbi:hypothetical protein VE03_09428 [Pseudogymnoascus sp. 23342-1-I1]|nr:hypothetical protein VE03_09428 [Pseudogymnoascus sp. 23342-1-I1]